MKVKDFLTESNWTKNAMARNRVGMGVHSESPDAVSFCLMGAINHCYRIKEERELVIKKVFELIPGRPLISLYNDCSTWEGIEILLKKADV